MVVPQASERRMPPTTANRISVSTAGLIQQKLLEYQATLTGRSISSLASSLLEEIIDQKVHAGQWHPTAIRLVEELIKEREAEVAFDHAAALASIRNSAKQGEDALEQQGQWDDVREALGDNRQAIGVFTDGSWAVSPEPKVDPREEELIAYGMRYGLSREEAEDLYERWEGAPRYNIRRYMREEAGHEERLPEGESIERKDQDVDDIPF